MKVLFLGGTSYLGKEIIKRLESLGGFDITVVYRDTPLTSIGPQDIIFNLVVDYGKGNKPLSEVMAANVLYPLNALEKIQFKTVINFSTGLDKKVSHYSYTKKVLEETLSYLGEGRFQVINLQLQHFFGPRAPQYNFVTFLIDKMLKGEELLLTDCQQKRDFIFIEDLLDAIEIVVSNLNQIGSNEIIEIGSGITIKLQDFVEDLKSLSKSNSNIVYGAVSKRAQEPDCLSANVEKIQKLGWKAKHSIHEGVLKTILEF
ncbi:MAG: NAD(P)-dependent oxidoreductase [Bacteriovoracaceae bacterium]|nr:NAD(P)-dependent oxidoreductase [Bacteriovoracaceae bacterium]